jgi:chaperonin GroEL
MTGSSSKAGVYAASAGIIDSAKVVRATLQDASAVAGLLIVTEAIVAELLKPKAALPPGGGMSF